MDEPEEEVDVPEAGDGDMWTDGGDVDDGV